MDTPRQDAVFRRFHLLRRHHALLLQCWWLLLRVRLTLTFADYRRVLRQIGRQAGSEDPAVDPARLVWAIRQAARTVPGASCLTQALACRYRLARSGQACTIRIGVALDRPRRFEAHAWVIREGSVILGDSGDDLRRYRPIVDL